MLGGERGDGIKKERVVIMEENETKVKKREMMVDEIDGKRKGNDVERFH